MCLMRQPVLYACQTHLCEPDVPVTGAVQAAQLAPSAFTQRLKLSSQIRQDTYEQPGSDHCGLKLSEMHAEPCRDHRSLWVG